MTSFILSRSRAKKNLRRFTSFTLMFSMVFTAFGPGIFAVRDVIAQGPPAKIEICHATGDGWMYMDSPAGPSLDAHLGHGDFLYTGVDVANKDAWCADHAPTPPVDDPTEDTGTLRVCKIILDDEGNSIAGEAGTTFTIPFLDENYEGDAVEPIPADVVFDTPLTLETIFGHVEGECEEHKLEPGVYYYGEETISPDSDLWEEPKYHDGYPSTATDLDSFGLYNTSTDESFDSFDGVINLSKDQTRNLYILNQMKEVHDEPTEEPTNSCLVPDMLDGEKIDSYGPSYDSPENPLQNILNNSYGPGAIDAEDDETGYQALNVPVGTATVTFTATFLAAIADYTNSFGYYTNGDINTFVPVTYASSTTVDTTGVTKIGFALKSINHQAVTNYFATELSENPGNNDHAVVFNPSTNTYVIAFEDINPLENGDKDYNDLVVEVVIDGCTEVPDEEPIECIPEKELIVNGSFEEPNVGGDWNVFESVLGWSFDWINSGGAPTPKLELHKGVSGWLSDDGLQHAELDGDWYGPSNSGQGGSTKLWQDIPTVPGKEYELKFSFSGRPNTGVGDNVLGVLLNGSDITGSSFSKSNNTGQTAWEQYTHKFTANSTSTKVQFQDEGTENSLGTFLDNVSLMCLGDEPEDCVETSGSIVSDESVMNVTDGNIPAEALTFVHPGWTASIPGATWIWATDPVESPTNDADLTKVFTKTFNVVGTPQTGTLDIAADNYYSVKINGISVGSELVNENNFQLATQDSYDVTSFLVNGANTIEITATNKEIGESADPAANPAGILFKLSWTAEDCGDEPEEKPSITLSAVKIECEVESLLPNWGAGSANITSTTASDWLNDVNHPERKNHCEIVPWDFQWAPADTSNPGDSTEYAGSPWTTFTGSTSIELSELNGNHVWVREALKPGYIGFGGENTTQNVSAEFYCYDDVLNYDNYEWIGKGAPLVDGSTYNCVGWNVPTEPGIVLGDVTMCKVDEEERPLSGWQLLLLGDKIGDTLVVDSESSTGTDSLPLVAGTSYVANAVGTWSNQNGANLVDAEYSTTDGWLTYMDGYTGFPAEILELQIAENPLFGDWGAYNDSHSYWQGFSPSISGSVNFRVFDGDANTNTQNLAWFNDNSGLLSVDIYEGYTGVTGENGCFTIEDVPFGTYTVDEALQDGWEVVDGTGEVTVDGDEIFTVMNRRDGGGNGGSEEKATLTIVKTVVGGNNVAGDFTLSIAGVNPSDSSVIGNNVGVDVTLDAGAYSVTEVDSLGYSVSYSADCSGNISWGETKTCTVTNTEQGGGGGGGSIQGARSSGGGGGGSSSDDEEDEEGLVAGAFTDLPGLPNTGNGAQSQNLIIMISLIVGLLVVNSLSLKVLRKN